MSDLVVPGVKIAASVTTLLSGSRRGRIRARYVKKRAVNTDDTRNKECDKRNAIEETQKSVAHSGREGVAGAATRVRSVRRGMTKNKTEIQRRSGV